MGSLFAALTTAVSGLNAQSSAIGNISENLANAQTTGYKSVGTNFEELVNASSATVNNPGGVTATPQYQNDVQGSIVSSNTPTSLAISGDGYFQVETATANTEGVLTNGSTYYTRQGDFTLDKNGYLVNGSGYYLMGNTLDSAGSIDTSTTNPIQISALLNEPVAASAIQYTGNLPSNAAVGYTSATSSLQVYDAFGNSHNVNYTWTKTGTNTWDLNVNIPDATDSNGQIYNATIPYTFNDGSGGTTAGTIKSLTPYTASVPTFTVNSAPTGSLQIGNVSIPWSSLGTSENGTVPVTLTASNGTASTVDITVGGLSNGGTAAEYAANMKLALNAVGAASTTTIPASYGVSGLTAGLSGNTITLSTVSQNVTPDINGVSSEVTWAANGTDGNGNNTAGTLQEVFSSNYSGVATSPTTGAPVTLSVGPEFNSGVAQPMTLNFGTYGGATGVTQFSDTNSVVTVSDFSQNGLPKGSFNSVSIDSSGNVSINYSNGTNKTIAAIPIASFYAQDQLQQVTGGAYSETLASGTPRINAPGVEGAGTISSSSLEESNVDISTEFTNLIQAQQVYSANAKVVTTDDSMLQVTLNMVQ